MALTNIACKNAKAVDRPLKLTDGQGLYLQVMINGSKYWRLKYRYAQKEKLLALGVYPEVSLQEAREHKEQARKLLSQGIDPSLAKKEKKLQINQNAENTFAPLAKEWLERQNINFTPKHIAATLSRLERDVFPYLGSFPVNDITPPMVLDVIRRVEKRGAFDVAHRVKQTCGQIFRYGVATGRAVRDPTADLKDAMRPYKIEHFAALDIKELPEFLNVLEKNEGRLFLDTRLSIKLLMLTFVRTSELINATWDEIDFDNATWIIPAKRMKMRRDHIVPLSRQVIEMFRELKEMNGSRSHVFPNRASPQKAMSNATIIRAISRMGYKDKMTGHGFRALAMTNIKENLGYRHEVVDRQLAHAKKNKIVAAYDRAEFINDRRRMMQEWADYIDNICKKPA